MRPRRLELQGFTAFRERQSIDFTSLDLFAITGPTGAGKTSLLDAMSLALYGRVPRMGGQGLGQLVSHGQAEARVLLEFEVDGDVYRVARRLPRNGAQSATFERGDGERWVDATDRGGVRAANEAILDCVVLDFESFCKAIVLPQGDFARFLKGDPSERRKTLVALLGLGVYERMGAVARERAKELRIRVAQTQSILDEQFADATQEALADAQEAVVTASGVAERAASLLTKAQMIDAARADAEARATSALQLSDRFVGISDALTLEVDACVAAESSRREAATRLQSARSAAEAAAQECKEATFARDELVQRVGTVEELSRLLDALERRRGEEKRIEDAERDLAAARKARDERAGVLDLAERRAAEDKAAAAAAREAEAAARLRSDERRAEHELAARRHAEALSANAALGDARSQLAVLEANAASAEAAWQHARETHHDLERRLEALRREHLVAALVVGVEAGAPCPVCTRPLTEHPDVDPDVADRLESEAANCTAAREEAEHAQQALATVTAQLRAAQARVAELARAVDGENFEALADRASEAADAAEESARALTIALEEREQADAAAQVSAAALERVRAELKAATEMLATRQANVTEATEAHTATLEVLRRRFGEGIPEDATEQLGAARAALQEASERLEAARRTESDAHRTLREAERDHQDAQATLAKVDIRLGELRSRAETARDDGAACDLPPLPIPDEARDVRARAIAEWCKTSARTLQAHGVALQEEAEHAGNELVAVATDTGLDAEDASAALECLTEYERSTREARVRAEAAAAELARRVDQRMQMETTIADSTRQTAVLDVLARDLRADHFIDFVVQETLDLLALRATAELRRISDDRYSLVSLDGGFNVIDHVNADEQRSVKTLSGGETFMASLSLALALSKHVSELAGEGLGARLEAVFIDEGFGSLDPDTLDEVIDALERLREDELLVGVISHVPALAQRIRAGIEVRTEGGYSRVAQVT